MTTRISSFGLMAGIRSGSTVMVMLSPVVTEVGRAGHLNSGLASHVPSAGRSSQRELVIASLLRCPTQRAGRVKR
jgi:hypothetical protein